MKKVPKLLILAFFAAWVITFTGCKKDAEIPTLYTTEVSGIAATTAETGGNLTSGGGSEVSGRGVCWSISENPTIADSKTNDGIGTGIYTSNLTGLIPGTTYFVRAYATNSAGTAYGNEVTFKTSPEQGIGQKDDFPGVARWTAASFSIGTKVYVGAGSDPSDFPLRDFWEWDQTTNVWIRRADFPGNSTDGVVSFSIGSKGYIGTGQNLSTERFTNEFWEYDPAANSWTQKASLPITPARAFATGFSIGTKGYIGLGIKDASMAGGSPGYYQDFWEWDQATNVWTKKADFPGMSRLSAVGFSIGNKGFIGTGISNDTPLNDFWEWDQPTNIWTQKISFAGNARAESVAFSIGNKGYIGTGSGGKVGYTFHDLWEYDPALK